MFSRICYMFLWLNIVCALPLAILTPGQTTFNTTSTPQADLLGHADIPFSKEIGRPLEGAPPILTPGITRP